jgi:hypothetical protein
MICFIKPCFSIRISRSYPDLGVKAASDNMIHDFDMSTVEGAVRFIVRIQVPA